MWKVITNKLRTGTTKSMVHTPEENQDQNFSNSADFLETFKQLQEGEKTAEKLESMLDKLEGKLEELLSQADAVIQEPHNKPANSKPESRIDAQGKTSN